jgi:hypothetical protein
MDYEEITRKLKQNSAICNDLQIDFQIHQKLSSQVLNSATPEKRDCDYLRTLCDQIGAKVLEFKQIIPEGNKTNEVN